MHTSPRFPCTFMLCHGGPAQACATMSVAASSFHRVQGPTWAMLWFVCTSCCTLMHALTLTQPSEARVQLRVPHGLLLATTLVHTRAHVLRDACWGTARQPASSSPVPAGQQCAAVHREPCFGCCQAQRRLELPDGHPLAGLGFLPARCSYQQGDSEQRSLHRARGLCSLCDAGWRGDGQDRRSRGTGEHSPTRMRMHTSSAMRAPGLSVADTM